MKKRMLLGVALAFSGMLSGCATHLPIGALYTEVKLPMSATANPGKKHGTAECRSILSLVAIGDCSIDAARKNGGISKVSLVDWEAKNILGIYGEYKVNVVGE